MPFRIAQPAKPSSGHLRSVVEFEENSCRKIVARDVFLVFLAVQTGIGLTAGLAYLNDKDGYHRNFFNDRWDSILSRHPIPCYYCIARLHWLLAWVLWDLLFIRTAVTEDLAETLPHAHQERTNTELKYVVEDLHGHYTPAKLDPKHMDRLKMLQLL